MTAMTPRHDITLPGGRALRLLLPLLLLLLASAPAHADGKKRCDRQKWAEEMTREKHKHLIKELDLTKEQQAPFFKAYDAMERELQQAGEEARQSDRAVEAKGDKATDADYDKAAQAFADFREAEGRIQKKYLPIFRQTLTARQLYKLRYAERGFRHEMMKRHQNLKGRKGKK